MTACYLNWQFGVAEIGSEWDAVCSGLIHFLLLRSLEEIRQAVPGLLFGCVLEDGRCSMTHLLALNFHRLHPRIPLPYFLVFHLRLRQAQCHLPDLLLPYYSQQYLLHLRLSCDGATTGRGDPLLLQVAGMCSFEICWQEVCFCLNAVIVGQWFHSR